VLEMIVSKYSYSIVYDFMKFFLLGFYTIHSKGILKIDENSDALELNHV